MRSGSAGACALLAVAMSFPAGQEEPAARNRLGQERSPYLRQHADNPVDWHPWGEEAFRRARDEDKPIFLSIGYSTCHWCHVMEEESFMNDGIARLLNERFVPIKVDREERPDVDQLYMTYVQASTGHGGWPMSVWLTPDLEPFVGATYFPPERFREVLEQIARVWREDRRRVTGAAREALDFLRRAGAPAAGGSVEVAALDAGRAWFERTYDRVRGGFGNAPKFPRPSELLFLLREHHRTGAGSARDMVLHALRAMARGGIHDHVGGGFHRYSVDERWHVPHFEKMLYDQAQLVAAYVEAWQLTGDEAHAAVARDILEYVLRRLTHADGGFFSAEDADTEHVEGATYVWTRDELEAALGDQTEEFCRRYGVRRDGNVSRGADIRGEMAGRNVLFLTEGAEPMPGALARLAEVRDRRPQPHRDDKVIAAWNGLMIGAFARAGFALDESRYVDAAARAGRFLWERLRVDGDLRRHWLDGPAPAPAVTADHAMVVQGFLDLYEATFDDIWISRALELQAEMDARFADAEGAGYFESRADPSLLVRTKELYDGAEPAANSVAALNLLRLERITGDRAWGRRAAGTLSLYASADAASAPYAMMAAQFQREGPLEIVFTGDAGPLVDVLRRRFVPHKVVLRPTALAPWTCLLASHEGTAFVCRNFACDLPATTPEELAERLGRAR